MVAATDAFHVDRPGQRVVFAAAVTRWLHGQGFEWHDLGVDLFEALRELDEHAPGLEIEATQLSRPLSNQWTIHWEDGRSE